MGNTICHYKNLLSVIIVLSILFFSSVLYCSENALAYVKTYDDVKYKIAYEGSAEVIIVVEHGNSINSDRLSEGNDLKVMGDANSRTPAHDEHDIMDAKSVLDSHNELLRTKGFAKHKVLGSINGYAGVLTSEGLEALDSSGLDLTIYDDTPFYILDYKVIPEYGASLLATQLNISTSAVNANYSWDVLNITGRGVKVGVIDTGIDYTHPDLGGCFGNGTNASCKVFDGYNVVGDNYDPMDDNGHGTHVSGILAANGSIRGVAPDATLYAYKACNSGGLCQPSDIILAMEHAMNDSIDIVSISLGVWVGSVNEGNSGQNIMSQEAEILADAGIVVVIAAGNSGPGVSTILAPADSKTVISVGAVEDNRTVSISDDIVWNQSSRGPSLLGRLDPELVAPGYLINSTFMGGGYYSNYAGTSMATPFVSGAAALLLEQFPELTTTQVRAILLQSTNNIAGKVFAKGSGELDIMDMLSGRVYALVNQTDTYNNYSTSDRWEFVILPSMTAQANITIFNDNDYNISFNTSLEALISMEHDDAELNDSQFVMPLNFNVTANSTHTLEVNFSLADFDSAYASTYGGIILLEGYGDNGTDNVSKSIRIPVIITVPIVTPDYFQKTFHVKPQPLGLIVEYPHEDVFHYCYYASAPRNLSVIINWSNSSNDLDLYVYGSDGSIDLNSGNSDTENESVMTSNAETFRWFRIDAYDLLSVPFTFDINVSSLGNNLPVITNVTESDGLNNGTVDNPILIFYRPENITLNISYYDVDNDSVNITINDSGFILVNESFNASNGTGYVYFIKAYNDTIPRNSTISVTLTDAYGGVNSINVSIMMYSSIRILGYSPVETSYLGLNDSINFTLDVLEANSNPLYCYWELDGILNSTVQNYTLYSEYLGEPENTQNHTVNVIISNNDTTNVTNETISWLIYFDVESPNITIQEPLELVYNNSLINISYDVSDDSSGVDGCWLEIDSIGELSSGENFTLNLSLNACDNTSLYLANGDYALNIFVYDSVNNIGSSGINFSINDSSSPIISSIGPSGTLDYVTSVNLSLITDENATCKYDTLDTDYFSMNSSFDDYITAHNVTIPVAAGTYVFYVRCSDMSNNTNTVSSNISFIINSAPPIDVGDEEGDEGSGGGSGGGGGTTYYAPSGEESVTGIIDEYLEGETDVLLEDDDIPIDMITIDMNSSGDYARFKVTKTLTPEYNYSELVYAYLEVSAESLTMEDLAIAKLYFNVKNDWLILNNISKENVILVHYDDITGNWVTLLTELLNESDNETYYVSHAPRFGLFAITHNSSKDNDVKSAPVRINEENATQENITLEVKDNRSNMATILSDKVQNDDLNFVERFAEGFADEVRSLSVEWIIIILFGVFIFTLSLGIALHKQGIKEYKEDIILGTHQSLKLENTEILDKALPGLSSSIKSKDSSISKNTASVKTAKLDEKDEDFQKLRSYIRSRKK